MRSLRVPARRDALRIAGAAVAVFILINLAGEAWRAPFDTLGDWLSRPRSPWLRHLLAAAVAAALLGNALFRERAQRLRPLACGLFATVALLAALDTADCLRALARGRLTSPAFVPASALVALFFTALAADAWLPGPVLARSPLLHPRRLLAVATVIAGLPLLRMATFGPSRYERSADCAVVFGARVYDDGRPSLALSDRVDEAVRLYRRGLVACVVMSGAIDQHNGRSEPEVMRARAEAQGVPRSAIVLDEAGVDTASTARNTGRWMRAQGLESALIVSHYYHEPRAKMLFDRAGVRTFTVPARMSRRLLKEPYFLVREVAAFYHSFLFE
jgi:uncharacterized SAM-binding protein YcdF (DUF218 family)